MGPFGWSGMLDKIFKNILDHSLLDAKGIMENIHPFSCNNFLNKKWAWSCHALLGGPACLTKF